MHVVAPARYQPRPQRRHKRPIVLVPLVVLLLAAAGNYLRPLPSPVATLSVSLPASAAEPALSWPATGQAAIAASGYGLLGTAGTQAPLATASIAKVVTALCVLQKQPLVAGQSGPTYTISASDVALYNSYVAQDGSVLRVTAGQQLTEYQALEAMMLPSANNIADSLVAKVFGSQAAYATYATDFLHQHELNQTHIGTDASGFDPSTTSTASDLTALGLLALKSPVLLQIAAQPSASLPGIGTVYNYNTVLGQNGITGLKTGNNDADPGAFLFTATLRIGGKDIPLTGAVMGAADLDSALQSSAQLVASEQAGFEQVTVAAAGQHVGTMQTPWGARAQIISSQAVQVIRWKATPLTASHQLHTSVRSGTIGQLKVSAGHAQSESTLKLGHPITGPSFWWRLTRH